MFNNLVRRYFIDNTTLNPGALGDTIATEDIGGVKHELVKLEFGAAGVATKVSAANPLPVTDAAAEASLASIDSKLPAGGLATAANQATEIAALASIASEDFATQATLAALLAKVIAAPSTEAKQDAMITLLTTIAAITQPLTDAQLRATPVPVSGTVTTGGLTDAQLRATPVPVSVSGGGDATAANQTSQITQETAINTVLGLIGDAIVAAGATGSISAKLRRATQGLEDLKTLIVLAAGTNIIGKVGIDQTTDGTTNKVRATATQKPSYGSTVVMTVTNLQSLASSATVGWQSARVSNLSTLATDYEIMVKLTTANTAPANDKAMYVFICPWYTSDGGTTWFPASQGTTTLPTGTEGASTIASPHNLRLLGVLNYTTQQMVVQDTFLLSNCFGNRMPDGFSIIIINFSGAALSTGCVVDYSPINDVLV